jgi:hypothetical protein
MTAADEIQAAAKELQADQAGRETVLPSGAIISATLAKPLAKLLRETAALHEPGCPGKRPDGTNCGTPHGCDWCGDEDWPCNDIRNALAVARAILGTQEQP